MLKNESDGRPSFIHPGTALYHSNCKTFASCVQVSATPSSRFCLDPVLDRIVVVSLLPYSIKYGEHTTGVVPPVDFSN